jgi:hypothetical protein
MKSLCVVLVALCSFCAFAAEKGCSMEKSYETIVKKLFAGKEHVYSLLWWNDPKSNVINARSFIINGHDTIPVFSSEAEGKQQVTGSAYEKDLVGIDPSLLAAVLQKMDYAILNPGGSNPIQFKTCVVKPYAKR